jgi:hypothetical protein
MPIMLTGTFTIRVNWWWRKLQKSDPYGLIPYLSMRSGIDIMSGVFAPGAPVPGAMLAGEVLPLGDGIMLIWGRARTIATNQIKRNKNYFNND